MVFNKLLFCFEFLPGIVFTSLSLSLRFWSNHKHKQVIKLKKEWSKCLPLFSKLFQYSSDSDVCRNSTWGWSPKMKIWMNEPWLPYKNVYIIFQFEWDWFSEIWETNFGSRVSTIIDVCCHTASKENSTPLFTIHKFFGKALEKECTMNDIHSPHCFKVLVFHEINAASVSHNASIKTQDTYIHSLDIIIFNELSVLFNFRELWKITFYGDHIDPCKLLIKLIYFLLHLCLISWNHADIETLTCKLMA